MRPSHYHKNYLHTILHTHTDEYVNILISVYYVNKIVKLHKGTHHGSINLVKERELLKQIKQTREEIQKINANVSREPPIRVRTYPGYVLGSKKAITDYIKVCVYYL